MLKELLERKRQGHRTAAFPKVIPELPPLFRGRPRLDPSKCVEGCVACVEACPADALTASSGALGLDLGTCLFCTDCTEVCPSGAVTFTNEYRLAARTREELRLSAPGDLEPKAIAASAELRKLLGRSLKLRQVSAGGCNGCEADVNVLGTVVFDLSRFGIQIVASPRHADGLLITGPVTENMKVALMKTYEAVPSPKVVIAVGACAIGGGPFAGHPESLDGAASVLPVDLFVPGCPPHPYTILEALLGFLGRRGPGLRTESS
ncbi:MAG: hydrogenase [Deltaproteobacteria bacterium]|nr:hydrogenase [Deltaproteobacteria bacterium]